MILLIGKNGMLGSELEENLQKKGLDYLAVDIEELDITDLDACRTVITEDVKTIINCAAYTNVDAAEDNEILAYKVNAIGPRNIAIRANEIDAEVVHISTDYVFNGFEQEKYSEMDLPAPIGVYGKSKLAGEKFVEKHCAKSYILRTSWLYGKNGNNFAETMIKLKDRDELKVVNDQFGTPTATFDLINLIFEVINSEKYGVYHATSEGRTTWYEFAKFIFETLETNTNLVSCDSSEFPTKAVRPKNSELVSMMIEAEGFNKLPYWQDSVRKYLLEVR